MVGLQQVLCIVMLCVSLLCVLYSCSGRECGKPGIQLASLCACASGTQLTPAPAPTTGGGHHGRQVVGGGGIPVCKGCQVEGGGRPGGAQEVVVVVVPRQLCLTAHHRTGPAAHLRLLHQLLLGL